MFLYLCLFYSCLEKLEEQCPNIYGSDLDGYKEVLTGFRYAKNRHTINQTNRQQDCCKKEERTFRFYIYELPANFNDNLTNCEFLQPFMCDADLQFHGMGLERFRTGEDGELSFRDTSQFSLAVIIHNKLKTNRLRTWHPDEADIFYIPVYFALLDLCNNNQPITRNEMSIVRELLSTSSHFVNGKVHISTLALLYVWMPGDLYLYDIAKNITFITMESIYREEQGPLRSEIVSPYPSYGHFLPSQERVLNTKPITARNIFILLPVGNRNASSEREILKQQFYVNTDLPYDKFMETSRHHKYKMLLYYTNACSQDSTRNTVLWLQNSVFCLQPAGDTETRKSVYDSILCGCIPVIITNMPNPYPFQTFIDYWKFSVMIPFSVIADQHENIYDILSDIPPEEVQSLQNNLQQIAQYMQYSIPSEKQTVENDALQLIFMELSDRFQLPYDKKLHLQ